MMRRVDDAAQLGHLAMDLGDRADRGRLAVELLGEPLDRDDAVRLQQQHGEHGPLVAAAERELGAAAARLERPEDPEFRLHGATVAVRKPIGSGTSEDADKSNPPLPEELTMRLAARNAVLIAMAATALAPAAAGAKVDQGCGKDYSKNAATGDYCATPTTKAARPSFRRRRPRPRTTTSRGATPPSAPAGRWLWSHWPAEPRRSRAAASRPPADARAGTRPPRLGVRDP